jgi:hypothetical protein
MVSGPQALSWTQPAIFHKAKACGLRGHRASGVSSVVLSVPGTRHAFLWIAIRNSRKSGDNGSVDHASAQGLSSMPQPHHRFYRSLLHCQRPSSACLSRSIANATAPHEHPSPGHHRASPDVNVAFKHLSAILRSFVSLTAYGVHRKNCGSFTRILVPLMRVIMILGRCPSFKRRTEP